MGAFDKGDGPSLKSSGLARYAGICVVSLAMLVLTGCPKGNQEYNEGKKSEATNDYDSAVVHYDRALKSDPLNTEYKLKLTRMPAKQMCRGAERVGVKRGIEKSSNRQIAVH